MTWPGRGEMLWSEFFNRAATAPRSIWADAFDPNRPLETPSRLNAANPAVWTAFADAVQYLQDNGLPLDAPWGDVRARRTGRRTDPDRRLPRHIAGRAGLLQPTDRRAAPGRHLRAGRRYELRHGGHLGRPRPTAGPHTPQLLPDLTLVRRPDQAFYSQKRWIPKASARLKSAMTCGPPP